MEHVRSWRSVVCGALLLCGCYDARFRPTVVIVGDGGVEDAAITSCLVERHTVALLEPGCAVATVTLGSMIRACTGPPLPESGVPAQLVVGSGLGPAEVTITLDCGESSTCGCVLVVEDVCGSCSGGCGRREVILPVDGVREILLTKPAEVRLCTRP